MSERSELHNRQHEKDVSHEHNYAQRLRGLFELPEDLKQRGTEQLWTTANNVSSVLVTPEQRNAVALFTQAVEWQAFGSITNNVPPQLIIIQDKEREHLGLDPRIPYLDPSVTYLQKELREKGFSTVSDECEDILKARTPEIKNIISDIIVRSPIYKVLADFDQPVPAVHEEPLSQFWIQVKQKHIEQDIRKSHRLDDDAPFRQYFGAHDELRRQLFKLANQTMPRKNTPEEDPLAVARAKAYVMPFVAQAFEETGRKFDGIYRIDRQDELFIKAAGADIHLHDTTYDYSARAAHVLVNRLSMDDSDLNFIPIHFTDMVIHALIDPHTTNSLNDILVATRDAAAGEITNSLISSTLPDSVFRSDPYQASNIFLRQPNVERMSSEVYENTTHYDSWVYTFDDCVQFGTRQEILRDLQTARGRIEKYGPNNFRTPLRLIMAQSPVENLSTLDGSEDLIIRYSTDGAPYIPGYKLVSKAHERWGFVIDPQGDPYKSCEVKIPAERLHALAGTYRTMGLGAFADTLVRVPDLTVAQFTDLVKEFSIYHLPDTTSFDHANPLNYPFNTCGSLEDFSKLVQKDALYVQCTGSALFLKYSLEALFEERSVAVASGYAALSASNAIISNAGHNQTVFTYESCQYILDATPEMLYLSGSYTPLSNAQYSQDQKNLHITKFKKFTDQLAQYDTKQETKEEKINRLSQALLERLRARFQQPSQNKLFEHLVTLPPYDPSRKAVETILQLQNQRISEDESKKTIAYLRLCSEADADAKKKVGIDHYSQELLVDIYIDTHYINDLYRQLES